MKPSLKGQFLKTSDEVKKVVNMADEGCPRQMALHLVPENIEILQPVSAEHVNDK
jgi:hypothetical protein